MTPTDKLRELLAAATPGPWRNGKLYDSIVADYLTLHDDKMSCEAYGGHLVCESAKMKANAALIAMAPDLSAEVIRLRAENAELVAANTRLVGRDAALVDALSNVVMSYEAENPMRTADIHRQSCACHRCDIDRARAWFTGKDK